jgi:hypothetical protein
LARRHGINVPDGLRLHPILTRKITQIRQPGPEHESFAIVMSECRVYWTKGEDGSYSREEVCLGLEIVPHSLPGGPIASAER